VSQAHQGEQTVICVASAAANNAPTIVARCKMQVASFRKLHESAGPWGRGQLGVAMFAAIAFVLRGPLDIPRKCGAMEQEGPGSR
jgi:hypothetical protein